MRRLTVSILVFLLLGAASAGLAVAQTSSPISTDTPSTPRAATGPVVDIVEVFGVLDSQLVGHVIDRIHEANRDHSALVVLELDSSGGLKVNARGLVTLVSHSKVPVAVWIGPRQARAASLAGLLALAAPVSAIGPSARLGPIRPLDLRYERRSDVSGFSLLSGLSPDAGGAASDLGASEVASIFARSNGRGDPAAILDASLGANEALNAKLIDYVVPSVAELLTRLDGKTITNTHGAPPVTLRLKKDEVAIRFFKPGPIRGLLHTFATTPALVYICLLGGAMLVSFELFQPGFGIAGISGAFLFAGAIFGMTTLPVGIWGIVMFSIGIAMLTLDVAINELGPATIAGTALLVVGSLRMFPAPGGALGVPGWLVWVSAVAALVYYVPVMTFVRRSRRDPEEQKAARALVGTRGKVRSMLNPEGFVWVADELWRARSEDGSKVRAGEMVVVTGADGILLRVKRA